jgi:ABC-type dipeptide/oligopeptide/nickel transport system ATPase component
MRNTKFNKRRFIHRLIALPFVFAIIFIAHNIFVLKRTWHYLMYGGEYVNFEENECVNMLEIYNMLKEIKENQGKKI